MNMKKIGMMLTVSALCALTFAGCGEEKEMNVEYVSYIEETSSEAAEEVSSEAPSDDTLSEVTTTVSEIETTPEPESESEAEVESEADVVVDPAIIGSDKGNTYEKGNENARNAHLANFKVFDKEGKDKEYTMNNLSSLEVLNEKMNINGNFSRIEDETYHGYLTECFGFNGQAYWLRGEGNSKMYAQMNSEGKPIAVVFTDVSPDYKIQFGGGAVDYDNCTNTDNVKNFSFQFCGGNDPMYLQSDDGKATFHIYANTYYALILEITGGALKNVMICNRIEFLGVEGIW